MKHYRIITLLAVGLTAVTISTAFGQGTVLLQHVGANDPTSEGFTLSLYRGSVEAVTNDLGMDAWATAVPENGLSVYYTKTLTSQQTAQISGQNWVLSLTLRVAAVDTSGLSFVEFAYAPYHDFSMFFGAASNGDPFVQMGSRGPSYSLTGAGSTYNTYQLVYTAADDTADLWVNGVDRIQNVPHYQNPPGYISWGSGLQSGPAQVNWNLVELSVSSVPEPSAIYLIFLGLAGAVSLRVVGWKTKGLRSNPLS